MHINTTSMDFHTTHSSSGNITACNDNETTMMLTQEDLHDLEPSPSSPCSSPWSVASNDLLEAVEQVDKIMFDVQYPHNDISGTPRADNLSRYPFTDAASEEKVSSRKVLDEISAEPTMEVKRRKRPDPQVASVAVVNEDMRMVVAPTPVKIERKLQLVEEDEEENQRVCMPNAPKKIRRSAVLDDRAHVLPPPVSVSDRIEAAAVQLGSVKTTAADDKIEEQEKAKEGSDTTKDEASLDTTATVKEPQPHYECKDGEKCEEIVTTDIESLSENTKCPPQLEWKDGEEDKGDDTTKVMLQTLATSEESLPQSECKDDERHDTENETQGKIQEDTSINNHNTLSSTTSTSETKSQPHSEQENRQEGMEEDTNTTTTTFTKFALQMKELIQRLTQLESQTANQQNIIQTLESESTRFKEILQHRNERIVSMEKELVQLQQQQKTTATDIYDLKTMNLKKHLSSNANANVNDKIILTHKQIETEHLPLVTTKVTNHNHNCYKDDRNNNPKRKRNASAAAAVSPSSTVSKGKHINKYPRQLTEGVQTHVCNYEHLLISSNESPSLAIHLKKHEQQLSKKDYVCASIDILARKLSSFSSPNDGDPVMKRATAAFVCSSPAQCFRSPSYMYAIVTNMDQIYVSSSSLSSSSSSGNMNVLPLGLNLSTGRFKISSKDNYQYNKLLSGMKIGVLLGNMPNPDTRRKEWVHLLDACGVTTDVDDNNYDFWLYVDGQNQITPLIESMFCDKNDQVVSAKWLQQCITKRKRLAWKNFVLSRNKFDRLWDQNRNIIFEVGDLVDVGSDDRKSGSKIGRITSLKCDQKNQEMYLATVELFRVFAGNQVVDSRNTCDVSLRDIRSHILMFKGKEYRVAGCEMGSDENVYVQKVLGVGSGV